MFSAEWQEGYVIHQFLNYDTLASPLAPIYSHQGGIASWTRYQLEFIKQEAVETKSSDFGPAVNKAS